jgi:uncharacterized protein (TIGR00725 family)
VGDGGIVRLGAHRVHLPAELLRQESELLPHGFIRGNGGPCRGQVRPEPHQLLGDVEPVGEKGDLLRQPRLVDRAPLEKLRHRSAQPVAFAHQALRSRLRHRRARSRQQIEPMQELAGECLAFPPPHRATLRRGRRDDRFDCVPADLWPASPVSAEHGGLPGNQLQRDLAGEAEMIAELPKSRRDEPRALDVHPQIFFRRGHLDPARVHRHVPPLEIAAEPLAELAFQGRELAGELGRKVEEAVIDRPDLNPETAACHRSFRGAKAGHAERQSGPPVLREAGKANTKRCRTVEAAARTDEPGFHTAMQRSVVGIIGAGEASPRCLADARALGRAVAERGWVVLTGGRPAGVMAAACAGAKEVPGSLTLGILPSDGDGAGPDVDIAVFTGMGDARNVVNVLTSDALVACGVEGAGTASEIAHGLKAQKPVILLGATRVAAEFFRGLPGGERVLEADSVAGAIRLLEQDLGQAPG